MTGHPFVTPILVIAVLSTTLAQNRQPASPPPSAVQQKSSAPDQDDVVRITTNLVQVDVVVTKDGKPVRDLKADDFEIFEDGHKQAITSFISVSNAPGVANRSNTVRADPKDRPPIPVAPIRPYEARRTMALVVDDLGSSAQSMSSEICAIGVICG